MERMLVLAGNLQSHTGEYISSVPVRAAGSLLNSANHLLQNRRSKTIEAALLLVSLREFGANFSAKKYAAVMQLGAATVTGASKELQANSGFISLLRSELGRLSAETQASYPNINVKAKNMSRASAVHVGPNNADYAHHSMTNTTTMLYSVRPGSGRGFKRQRDEGTAIEIVPSASNSDFLAGNDYAFAANKKQRADMSHLPGGLMRGKLPSANCQLCAGESSP